MKHKLKLTAMSLAAIGTVVAPVATMISCDSGKGTTKYKLLPTYTGQADQLIALGIKADYYPLQLDQDKPFDYLTDPAKYMIGQSDAFKTAFAAKIKALFPNAQGTSWWNQQAIDDSTEKGSDPEYWSHIEGDLTLYEHYLLDDGAKTIDANIAPRHLDTPQTFIQTNFRASRDPYTRLSKGIIEASFHKAQYDKLKANTDDDSKSAIEFIDKMFEVARNIEGEANNEAIGGAAVDGQDGKSVDGKVPPSGYAKREATDEESWIYNDFVFIREWHTNFEHNDQFKNSTFGQWILKQRDANNFDQNWAFDKDPNKDHELSHLFFDSTFQETEKNYRLNEVAATAYGGAGALALHHPIYEQQEEIGGAPMFEGAMRDNSLYLYDLASKIQKAFTKDPNAEGTKYLLNVFNGDARLPKLEHALDNADKINQDLRTRMASVKKLVDKMASKKGSAPTFGIVTIAPGGGVSTVQSSSKYSFVYKELGFTQPLPKAFPKDTISKTGEFNKDGFFNMDDNGWWWNISTPGNENGVSDERVSEFDKFDYGVLTANDTQYNGTLKADDKKIIGKLFGTDDQGLDVHKRDYNLWNEGLKTPFVLHMILDEVVNQIKVDAITAGATAAEINDANNWGSYFTTDFLA